MRTRTRTRTVCRSSVGVERALAKDELKYFVRLASHGIARGPKDYVSVERLKEQEPELFNDMFPSPPACCPPDDMTLKVATGTARCRKPRGAEQTSASMLCLQRQLQKTLGATSYNSRGDDELLIGLQILHDVGKRKRLSDRQAEQDDRQVERRVGRPPTMTFGAEETGGTPITLDACRLAAHEDRGAPGMSDPIPLTPAQLREHTLTTPFNEWKESMATFPTSSGSSPATKGPTPSSPAEVAPPPAKPSFNKVTEIIQTKLASAKGEDVAINKKTATSCQQKKTTKATRDIEDTLDFKKKHEDKLPPVSQELEPICMRGVKCVEFINKACELAWTFVVQDSCKHF